jgi:L-lysine 2,3-aminomutase
MDFVNIRPRYVNKLEQVDGLTEQERQELQPVAEKFTFRTNEYYQSLIDWNDPDDPIRRIVMPDLQELDEFGEMDASDEHSYTALKGLEHKYGDTALLLVNNVCGAYCRFCFRKPRVRRQAKFYADAAKTCSIRVAVRASRRSLQFHRS